MKVSFTLLTLFLCSFYSNAQNYTSYFTGNPNDTISQPLGGICLMGGASEDDNAMIWFLNRADGGDILVLRASGSDGYNDYLFSDLGVDVNSVETIVCTGNVSNETYIQQKIEQAEAIWFAGGDQWDYVSLWRNNAIDSLINIAINERNVVIGGTSAGMAIQGDFYFSAENGTITSQEALSNPFDNSMTVDSTHFIENNFLENTITDTHFDDPDRKGRLTAFLAKMWEDYNVSGKAIACNEYTAVCIDPNGIASVYGGYPTWDEFAYFVQLNCELEDGSPEVYQNGTPLTWNHFQKALRVYKVPGTPTGENQFDLNDWKTGSGGEWLHWSANAGVFSEISGQEPNCENLSVHNFDDLNLEIFPNPCTDYLTIQGDVSGIKSIYLVDISGRKNKLNFDTYSDQIKLNVSEIVKGIYSLQIEFENQLTLPIQNSRIHLF